MRYDNSLTNNVQDYIANKLAKKVSAAQDGWSLSGAARDVRNYLCDQTTLNTPDFVIRRFIQANHCELLPQNVDIPNLLECSNVPWNPEILSTLAKSLAILSKECGTGITKNEWTRYLSGSGASQREKVFKIAFTLNMDVDTTIDLLLAFDMEAYSVRYPLDLICLFCQHTPGKYSWPEAEEMLAEFMQKRIPQQGASIPAPTQGMTRQISSDLEAIFAESLPDADAKNALVNYMIKHSGEFVSIENNGTSIYLPGYSLTRLGDFMRLSDYLTVLYPEFLIIDEKTPKNNEIKKVEFNADGSPSLSFLARSMFLNSEWRNIIWRKQDAQTDPIGSYFRKLCQNYEQHIMKIERLRKGGDNVAFFERRDALLFTYFLLNGYIKLVNSSGDTAKKAYETIEELLNSGSDFDYVIADALEKAEYVFQYSDDESHIFKRFNSLIESFNFILTELGYSKLYLPARFDRFAVLALLSATPDELTPLIMCQEELDYYESQI